MKKIFIASSDESLVIAQNIQHLLGDISTENPNLTTDVVCWRNYSGFRAGTYTLDVIEEASKQFSGAIFIFNNDDIMIKRKDNKRYEIVRDNVLFELGVFCGQIGHAAVAICTLPGVYIPTDLLGLTNIPYNLCNTVVTKEQLRSWVERIPDTYNLPPKNVYIGPREYVHERCSLDERLHIEDGGYKYISDIRIMNFACNLFLNPEIADIRHLDINGTSPMAEKINQIMCTTSATLRLILSEPSEFNLFDVKTKIANHRAGGSAQAITSAIRAVYNMLSNDTIYRELYGNRFELYFSRISLPFGIFNVEYVPKYKRYNHIKIDLYSAELDTEDHRRSFIIWEQEDPDNYHFFLNCFNNLKMDRENCITHSIEELKEMKG